MVILLNFYQNIIIKASYIVIEIERAGGQPLLMGKLYKEKRNTLSKIQDLTFELRSKISNKQNN